LNQLRVLASQTEEEQADHKDVSEDELMDFEQELLDMDDHTKEDDTPALIPPPTEIRVNSEHLVDRVSDVVVVKMKRELRRQTQASEALLARMEQKLDLLLQQEAPTRTVPTTSSSKDAKVCYYCREEGHLANKCKDRVKCKGCGGDKHPYDRCEDKLSTCAKCELIGHSSAVHETKDPVLRKTLYDTHPDEFAHFFLIEERAEPAQNRLHRGTAKRRSSWEDGSRKTEHSSKSRNREPRDKYPRTDLGKGRGSRRTV
jgi:hypothetical protein